MQTRRAVLATLAAGTVAVSSLAFGSANATSARERSFSFALVGDYNYDASSEVNLFPIESRPKWQESARMISAINADTTVKFTIHLGDTKGGSTECRDNINTSTKAEFDAFVNPLIYNFGDNEWTDCHRFKVANPTTPFGVPSERQANLRTMFYPTNQSQGATTLTLKRQADVTKSPAEKTYVENVMWRRGGVVFVGVDVPGSNNNYSGGPSSAQTTKVAGQDEEWAARTAAVDSWIRKAFADAKKAGLKAVFISWQGNPDFENRNVDLPAYDHNGYDSLLKTLQTETMAFDGQVYLAHGDSHRGFYTDHPMTDAADLRDPAQVAAAKTLANFTRIENYGNPNTHFTKATVFPDRSGAAMFEFSGVLVTGNPYVKPA